MNCDMRDIVIKSMDAESVFWPKLHVLPIIPANIDKVRPADPERFVEFLWNGRLTSAPEVGRRDWPQTVALVAPGSPRGGATAVVSLVPQALGAWWPGRRSCDQTHENG